MLTSPSSRDKLCASRTKEKEFSQYYIVEILWITFHRWVIGFGYAPNMASSGVNLTESQARA